LKGSQKIARLIGELKFDEVEKLLKAEEKKANTESWKQIMYSNMSVMHIYLGDWEKAEKCFSEIEKNKCGKAVQNVVANNRAFLRLLQGRIGKRSRFTGR
jgi:Flp pilus assembly protein TadD